MPGWPIRKNEAGTLPVLEFPIYDADGDLVSAAAALDSERSIDQGTFTDCTNEAIEIATGSGVYSLAVTQAELNGDEIAFITKTSTGGAKTAVNVLYTSTRNIDDLSFPATSGRSTVVETDGMVHADLKEWLGVAPLALVAQRVNVSVGAMAADTITASAYAVGAIAADAFAAGAINAAAIATGAITNLTFAAGAIDAAAIAANAITSSEFAQSAADLVWGTAVRDLTALGFNLSNTDFAAGAIDANAIATDAIGSDELAASAIDEIQAVYASGTSDAGGSSTTLVDNALTELDDVHIGNWVRFSSGAVDNQVRLITEFVAATDTITFAPAVTASIGAGFTYELLQRSAGVDVQSWLGLVTGLVAPSALISGRVDTSVGAMQADVITASAVAVGAIAADAFVAGAIDAAAIANGAIDAATFAANAIDDAAMAADAHDGLFIRDIDQVEASAPLHSITTAILKAVSRIRDNAGTLEIYRTDGSTIHASQTVTVDATLDPVDELTVAA